MEHRTAVTQLLPADGWRAVHADTKPETPDNERLHTQPLVAWALVAHVGCCKHLDTFIGNAGQDVVGLAVSDLGVGRVDEDSNFVGYLEAGADPWPWMHEDAKRLAEQEARRRPADREG